MKLYISNFVGALVLLGVLSVLTSSCQTIRGAGRDVENAGEGIQRATR